MDASKKNKQNIVSDNRGITLIELLIGIAIMGIVSSMISVIMVGGTNFFRKQSATIDLQNDSQLITSSMSAAILEGTDFTLQDKLYLLQDLVQYGIFLKRSILGGDWGMSEALYRMQDVWTVFVSKLPATLMVLGTVPYMELTLEDEDSLTDRFDAKHVGKIDLAVIHYPRISNFTDFDVFEQMPEVSVRYVTNVREMGMPDLIFLPGSKNTMGDLKWMRQNGLEAAVKRAAGKVPIFGICGGYQMLGCEIADPAGVEEGGQIRGMELLPVRTVLQKEKHRCQTDGTLDAVEGIFSGLTGCEFTGYEIHMGQTVYCNEDGSGAKDTVDKATGPANSAESNRSAFCADDATRNTEITQAVIADSAGRIYGSYIHGLFDKGEIAGRMIQTLAREKGISLENGVWEDYRTIKERQYDQLADTLREYLRMEDIYGMLREARIS